MQGGSLCRRNGLGGARYIVLGLTRYNDRHALRPDTVAGARLGDPYRCHQCSCRRHGARQHRRSSGDGPVPLRSDLRPACLVLEDIQRRPRALLGKCVSRGCGAEIRRWAHRKAQNDSLGRAVRRHRLQLQHEFHGRVRLHEQCPTDFGCKRKLMGGVPSSGQRPSAESSAIATTREQTRRPLRQLQERSRFGLRRDACSHLCSSTTVSTTSCAASSAAISTTAATIAVTATQPIAPVPASTTTIAG